MTDELIADGNGRIVHLERVYRATPEQLWDAWTDPERLAQWLGKPAGPVLGATEPVRMILGDGSDQWADVRVVTADRPGVVELSWDISTESGSVVRVEFVPPTDGRTRLVLDHRGLTVSVVGYGAGWQAYLEGELAWLFGAPRQETSWAERLAERLPNWLPA